MAVNIYVPIRPPVDPKDLPQYLDSELNRLSGELAKLGIGIHHNVMNYEPAKVSAGYEMYADGVNFNPDGSGREGLYVYTSIGWLYLGGGSGGSAVSSYTDTFMLMGA